MKLYVLCSSSIVATYGNDNTQKKKSRWYMRIYLVPNLTYTVTTYKHVSRKTLYAF